jgi:para-aminobenzoate synthetase component 1
MIRYIEKKDEKYFYRSGGGITTQSVVDSEYQEMIDKVYVPID